MNDISTTIKNLRKKANLTQSDFANAVGVHFQTVSKWERGASSPDISMLCIIANALGVSIEALIGVEENSVPIVGEFNAQTLAQSITDYRKANGLNQTELAEKVGVSPDIVSKWERGIVCPDIGSLIALSTVFKVAPSLLYYGITNGEKPEKKIFYGKRKTKWAIIISSIALFCLSIALVIIFLPWQTTHTVTLNGKQYSVRENEWFSPENTDKQGYYIEKIIDEKGDAVTFPCLITGDNTFYVIYKPIEYALNLWTNGGIIEGNVKSSITVTDGAITLPIPQKQGDFFMGWFFSPDYSGAPLSKISCNFEDITLYAKWENTVFTVKYTLDGGVCENNPVLVNNSAEHTLCNPTKAGYTFLGWFDSPTGGKKYDSVGGRNAKNLTLYALYQRDQSVYKISYELNGGMLDGINPSEITGGETHRLIAPQKLGHDFIGWFDNALGEGESYGWITGSKDLTLYAVFSPKTYVIRYEFKGVYQGEANPSFVEYGQSFTLNPVIAEGYDFIGWSDSPTDDSYITTVTPSNIESISVLYARYSPKKYDITLFGNGGSFTANGEGVSNCTLSYEYDTVVPLPDCHKDKCEFLGWQGSNGRFYERIDSKSYHYGPFTAKWRLINGYEIVYVLDGGEMSGDNPVSAFPESSLPLGVVNKSGFKFLGWNDHPDGTGAYYTHTPDFGGETLTLYAIWQENVVNGSTEFFEYEKTSTQVTITEYTGKVGENVDLVIPSFIDGLPVTKIATRCYDDYLGNNSNRLKSLTLPSNLIEIESKAFDLISISDPLIIPKSVEILGENFIRDAHGSGGSSPTALSSLQFEEGSRIKVLQPYSLYFTIKDVLSLPEGLEVLEKRSTPRNVFGLILPNSIKEIKSFAFELLPNDIKVYIPPNPDIKLGEMALDGVQLVTGIDDHSVTIKDGEKVVAKLFGKVFNLPVIEKAGYDFVGWKNDNGAFVSKFFVNEENKDVALHAIYEPNTLYNGREATRPLVISPGDDDKVFTLSLHTTYYVTLDGYGEEAYYNLIFSKGNPNLSVVVRYIIQNSAIVASKGFTKDKCVFPYTQEKNHCIGKIHIYFSDFYGAPSAIEFSVETVSI